MKKTNAFSLLELSIVLVIIGLIAGGIVAGSSMIRAAELRAIITEKEQYVTAVYTFRDKYLGLPGDLKNATAFWGDNATHCADAAVADGAPGACNGDGNGVIIQDAAAVSTESEGHMFWTHLANAELISGTYTGISGPASPIDDILGENVPASKFQGGGWNIEDLGASGPYSSTVEYLRAYGRHHLEFGADDTSGDEDSDAAILTAEEAWNIDKKTDDGLPGKGNVVARYWNDRCGAADDGSHAADDLEASYKLTDTSVQCALLFLNNF